MADATEPQSAAGEPTVAEGTLAGASLGEATASRLDGPPPGFGATVNEYLNHYVAVADAKAAGFMAAALTVGAAVVKLQPKTGWTVFFYCAALALLGVAGIAGALAIFPRLPSGLRGLIFWEDIRGWKTPANYGRALAELTPQAVEFEYSTQNYFVSDVLHRKHVWVRWTICLFMLGAAAAVVAYLMVRNA